MSNNSVHGCGAAFFPEHWPRETWPDHIRLMKECGIRFVRMFEFAWSRFEPREGEFHFDWVDECLELLKKNDIRFILCTPGATPPNWLTTNYPDALIMAADGRRDSAEIRRHGCPNTESFLSRNLRLTQLQAERYGRDDYLLGWQIDNELGAPVCYCPNCQEKFRNWLKDTYGKVENLNEALGMVVFSREFSDWDEVHIPVVSYTGLRHVFRQWTSVSWLDYVRRHVELLREYSAASVTTNMMAPWHGFDHFEMAKLLDVVAMDYYPDFDCANAPYSYTNADLDLNLGYTRAIAGAKTFWMSETQALGANHCAPPPGRIEEWVLRMLGHGSNLFSFFRWAKPRFGYEELAYGIVGPGTYTSPRFEDVQKVCRTVWSLAPHLSGTTPKRAEVALLFSNPSWWKHMDHPPCSELIDDPTHGYLQLLRAHCRGLLVNGVTFDLVAPEDDWSAYKCVIAPHCLIVDNALAEHIAGYSDAGGTFFMTAISAFFNDEGVGHIAPYPAPQKLRNLLGISYTSDGAYVGRVGKTQAQWVDGTGSPFPCRHWIDQLLVEAEDVEVWMRYENAFYHSFPALVRRGAGKGQVLYLGTSLPDQHAPEFYRVLLQRLNVQGHGYLPEDVWSRSRVDEDGREIEFIQNFSQQAVEILLKREGTDLRDGVRQAGKRILQPHETLVLEY